MAVFEDVQEEWNRLDFQLLRDHPVTLYHKPAVLDDDLGWLQAQGYAVHRFTASAWSTLEDFHAEVSKALKFPAHYGRNLDAFRDCLSELKVTREGGLVLVFVGFDEFHRRYPEQASHVLDIIAGRSRHALLFGRRLLAVVQSSDPRLQLSPVGSTPVGWNRREWSTKDRGLQGAS